MLLLLLAGAMAGVAPPPVEDVVRTSAGIGASTPLPGKHFVRGPHVRTKYVDGKPVESVEPVVIEAPAVEAVPLPLDPLLPTPGLRSDSIPGVEAESVAPVPPVDGKPLAVKGLRAVRIQADSLSPAPIQSGEVTIGDGEDDVIRLAALLFGLAPPNGGS